MLKLAGVFAGLVALTGVALAQPPERVIPEDKIFLGIGQAQTFRFKSSFQTVNVVSQGVAKASAQSDRVLTLIGEAEGETTLIVYGSNGEEIYSALVTVTPEPGRIVRIYGRRDIKDYTGFYCTPTACGRADKDVPTRDQAGTKTVTVTRRGSDGSVTTTDGPAMQ